MSASSPSKSPVKSMSGRAGLPSIAFRANFRGDSLPDGFTFTRSGAAQYQDVDGYWQSVGTNTPRMGAYLFGLNTLPGLLMEDNGIECRNLYARPTAGVVGDHFDAGDSIASIITDSDNPCKDLTSGDQVWELDNSGGGSDVDVEFAGATDTATNHSAFAYIESVSGDAPTLSINGSGTEELGHTVAGYQLHYIRNGNSSTAQKLRITVPAGAVCRVACANLQQYRCVVALIDNAGTNLTTAQELLTYTSIDNWYEEIGTLYFEFTGTDYLEKACYPFDLVASGGGDYFRLTLSGTQVYIAANSNSVSQFYHVENVHPLGLEFGQHNRIAWPYKTDDAAYIENGRIEATDNSFTAPRKSQFSVSNSLGLLDRKSGGSLQYNGIIHDFRFYRTRLSNKACQALTNPNIKNEIVVMAMGDSNLWRAGLDAYFKDEALEATLRAGLEENFANVIIPWRLENSSCLSVTNATNNGVFGWYDHATPANNPNGVLEGALRTVTGVNLYQLTNDLPFRLDYIVWDFFLGDGYALNDATMTQGEFSDIVDDFVDYLKTLVGDHVKFIWQGGGSTGTTAESDVGPQAIQNVILDKVANNSNFIGYYDTYHNTRADTAGHWTEAGYVHNMAALENIISAYEGVEELIEPPEITGAIYNGNTVTIPTNDSSISGTEYGHIRIEDDGSPVTISSMSITDGVITLTLSSSIASGSDVKLWIGYGLCENITPQNVPRNTTTNYPVRKVSEYTVSEA